MRTRRLGRRRFTAHLVLAVVVGLGTALVALPAAGAVPGTAPGPTTAPTTWGATPLPGTDGSTPGAPARPPATTGAGARRGVVAPCAATARTCVQLSTGHIWLTLDGEVLRDGFVSSGGIGQETPTGTFAVQWKSIDHVSGESGVPMPYSVFFTDRGHALHQGGLDTRSAGCVRLERDDAAAFFAALQPGDRIQILP